MKYKFQVDGACRRLLHNEDRVQCKRCKHEYTGKELIEQRFKR